jgi:hypothetical protein
MIQVKKRHSVVSFFIAVIFVLSLSAQTQAPAKQKGTTMTHATGTFEVKLIPQKRRQTRRFSYWPDDNRQADSR